MPRFYCDYCDIYLTHDSTRVRKDHNAGWKHKMHVQNYYTEVEGHKVQQIINSITKAYVYAGLGGFPELPGQQKVSAKPAQTQFQLPPGFRPPMGPNGLPLPRKNYSLTVAPPGMFAPGMMGMAPPRPPPRQF